jgi:hypothetical protein
MGGGALPGVAKSSKWSSSFKRECPSRTHMNSLGASVGSTECLGEALLQLKVVQNDSVILPSRAVTALTKAHPLVRESFT